MKHKNLFNNDRSSLKSLRIVGALALATLLAMAFSSCKRNQAAAVPAALPPAEVSVVQVKAEAVPVTSELPGRLDAVRVAEVRARATGILLKRLFAEGAEVKEGEVLFEIDPAPLKVALDSAHAALSKAEANRGQAAVTAERNRLLVEKRAVSKQEYDNANAALAQAEADVQAAQAQVDTASLNLSYTKVTAPINGRIGKARVTEGALVSATEATPLAIIQQLDPIYFDFTQSSTEVLRLRRAMESGVLKSVAPGAAKVTLILDDASVYPQTGKMVFSDVTVDPSTGMITLRAEVPNPDKMLMPGMFARARLEQAVNSEALTLPQRAVARNANGSGTVMVVTAENKVEPRKVTADTAVGDKWIIADGVRAGERVIIEGLQKVRPGAEVKVVPYEAKSSAAAAAAASAKGPTVSQNL